MINVEYCFDGDLVLEALGHAEYSQGDDIVCASVSALTETLASFVSSRGGGGSVTLSKGLARIRSKNPDDLPFFQFTLHGLMLISMEYPENVRIKKGIGESNDKKT